MTPRISHAIVLTIISALPLATRAGAVTLPDEFSPEAVREIITEHLDEEVLVRLTTPNDEPVEPAWAETVGLPLIRVLRELWVLSVAIERENDQATRERLRGQYDQRFELLVSGFRDTDDGLWYTTTTYDGTEVTDEAKQTVGQTYVVYVMAEIAHRISDSRARRLAIDTFAQIAQRAHDSEHGGYVERVDRPLDADENAVKQLGTNMHVGLALARLHRIAPT
ncbi:MAG TPA: AGE family epimerase/isomerase, partial [Armatimonadota bacterium]|nr:AGE family epimerase/isomerase [Armatimonadota bacterium]